MARIEIAEAELAQMSPSGGQCEALFNLGLKYSIGIDVETDMITAHKWFNLAAISGNDRAKEYRQEISRELSSEEIIEAQKLAREWVSIN